MTPATTFPASQAGLPTGGADPALSPSASASGWLEAALRALPYVVGVAALIAYATLVNGFLDNARLTLKPEHWERAMFLFSSVESIAFAAAGFFFGREVNRGRAQAAEAQAQTEAARARKAQADADAAQTRGKLLTRDLMDLVNAGAPAGIQKSSFSAPGVESPAYDDAVRLARRAEALFPLV